MIRVAPDCFWLSIAPKSIARLRPPFQWSPSCGSGGPQSTTSPSPGRYFFPQFNTLQTLLCWISPSSHSLPPPRIALHPLD